MPKGSLLNRLSQPIPENCPLSEAVVWLINGTLPISSEDLRITQSQSLCPDDFGYDIASTISIANQDGGWDRVSWEEFNAAINKLLMALNKGSISSIGLADKHPHSCDYHHQTDENFDFGEQSVWDEDFKTVERSKKSSIPSNYWAKNQMCVENNILFSPLNKQQYYFIEIPTDKLFSHFSNDYSPETLTEAKSKRGRPPIVFKELWLEELALLFLNGQATTEDNIESLASSLIEVLSKKHNKNISLETVRKDWLRPLFKETKKRNGGK